MATLRRFVPRLNMKQTWIRAVECFRLSSLPQQATLIVVSLFILSFALAASAPNISLIAAQWMYAFATWGIVIVGLWTGLWVRRRLHQLEEDKARDKAQLALNLEIDTKVYHAPDYIVLEIAVDATNPTDRFCTCPAVYISADALVDTDAEITDSAEPSSVPLYKCGLLSEPINEALIDGSVIWLAPNETERFTRYERLSHTFSKRYPFLVIQVRAFATDMRLKTQYKRDWLELVARKEAESTRYIMFKRYGTSQKAPPDCRDDERYIGYADGSVDTEATRVFATFLKDENAMAAWTRDVTFDLRKADLKS